jgi:hypothetical protein
MVGPNIPNPPEDPKRSLIDSAEFQQALKEFRSMLRYALGEGLELDEETRKAVAAVQEDRTHTNGNLDELIKAHVALSKIIAPATPLSLEATEPGEGLMGSLRNPPLIGAMIMIAAFAATGFVLTSILFAAYKIDAFEVLNWLCAAALGAVFYVLFTAHTYVKDRTFDPRYNSLYVIRFVLGVLAGLILAIVLSKSQINKNSTVSSLGPSVIALLGGFSTEAVYQILQRLVDVLLAAVRGDDSGAAKTKASQTAQKELLTLADDTNLSPELKSKAIAAAKKVGA